ncbi:MAG: ATP-binding protein [Pseudobutyrivibrio sp.]|nr:ATP-binding protein [Pseudobutyrivibrio sp.]
MVNHTIELKQLEAVYETSGNTVSLLFGKRGSEKELLFKQFAMDKPCFYYRARQCSDEKQLVYLSKQIQADFSSKLNKITYDECFTRLRTSGAKKLVIIIDECQNIIKKNSLFLESIIKLKSKKLYPGPVMIIFATSSKVWANNNYGELVGESFFNATSQIELNELTFLDVVRAFPKYSVSDCVATYGIIGGNCKYINRWDGNKSIKQNVCDNILRQDGFLFDEAEAIIGSELREPSCYETILASIAEGNEKLNDLFEDTGYSRAKISVYMKNLAAFDIIDKAVSFETGGWENTKKGVYRISNPFINFYFTFIYPHLSEVYTLTAEEFYNTYIEKGLDDYLQIYFANVCREYLFLLNKMGQLPIKITSIGTWIGKEATIDVLGQSSNRENIVGICNWNESFMPYQAYEQLLDSMKKAKINAKSIFLFSATAFDERLKTLEAEDSRVVLVDMTEL